MNVRQTSDFQLGDQKLAKVEFRKRGRRTAQGQPHAKRTPILMKIDDEIVMLRLQKRDDAAKRTSGLENLRDVWTRGIERLVGRLGKDVHLHIAELPFQATDDGRGEDDVANGTEPDDKNLFQDGTLIFMQRYTNSGLVRQTLGELMVTTIRSEMSR